MALRKEWTDAKSLSLTAFKEELKGQNKDGHAASSQDIVTGNIPAYPLKFKEDLGPTLDKYEAAAKKNDPKKTQYLTEARNTITSYRNQINSAHLPPMSKKALTDALSKISGQLH